jgi:tubulin-specific chaperone D
VLIGQHQLDAFQEWPQLLDPILPQLVTPLVQTFLRFLAAGSHEGRSQTPTSCRGASILPSAVCSILNALCKVRGVKVITRFLENEPKHLEPMTKALLLDHSDLDWQDRYILLLWLSHLVLTPFDLESISSSNQHWMASVSLPADLKRLRLPGIASALISAGLEQLGVASKERESASQLVVRLVLRPDMQRLGLPDSLVELMFAKLHDYAHEPAASSYECLGCLSVLSGILKSGSPNDVLPFLTSIFDFGLRAATSELAEYITIRASAPARKMLVAILRTSTLHAITLNSRDGTRDISDDILYGMLEGTIQYLLDALGDKDTPVRLAASKALSMLAQKLDEGMKGEVVQAVLETLEEDVLYEKPDSGDPVPARLLTNEDVQSMSRNMTAVNPLKWQGLLLTLGHMLFRRTAPPDQLSAILKSLLSGLDFEQRSAGGTSIGGSVRDAACFGLWSLARKYSTPELQAIVPTSILPALKAAFSRIDDLSVLQIIANQLAVSACLDPSGNLRRGSSAALQELIGRHPDMINQGIALVQVVDYHAVARRSRAMLDVAQSAAELANEYRWALLNALLGWRGVRAVDDDSRRTAAAAISRLVSSEPSSDSFEVLNIVRTQLSRLPMANSKTVAETRHGLLITISRILCVMDLSSITNINSNIGPRILSVMDLLWEGISMDDHVLGSLKERFIPELVLEGAAKLISSLARGDLRGHSKSLEQVIEVLDVCITRADQDNALSASAAAAFEVLRTLPVMQQLELVMSWLNPQRQRRISFSSKGRILAFGAVYPSLPDNKAENCTAQQKGCRKKVFAQLTDFIEGNWPIETQITALRSLASMIPHLREENFEKPLCTALDNYTNDQRGDVGSLARSEAIKAASAFLLESTKKSIAISDQPSIRPLVQRLFRIAGEKLDKLRFEAWKCIEVFLAILRIHSDQR